MCMCGTLHDTVYLSSFSPEFQKIVDGNILLSQMNDVTNRNKIVMTESNIQLSNQFLGPRFGEEGMDPRRMGKL